MNLLANLRVAAQSLMANKMRSLLTMLGVIIGVAAVIIVIAIGEGLKEDTLQRIRKLGTNLITIRPGRGRTPSGREGHLTLRDVEALRKEAKGVSVVCPEVENTEPLKYRNLSHSARVVGTVPEWEYARSFHPVAGRFINNADIRARAAVCVIGKTIVDELFAGRPQLDVPIKIRGMNFRVVGILEEKGGGFGDPDNTVIIPFTTALTRLWATQYLSSILVSATSEADVEEATASVTAILRRQHRLRPEEDDDFRLRSQTEFLTTMAETGQMMTSFLTGIALVSLLVGGVGIMNIMLVSVTERTREIGIRKAVGAKFRDIMLQFIIESTVLSLVGGVIGIGAGLAGTFIIGTRLGFQARISPIAVLISFCFAALVGIFFGFYPARKAALLNPIEALRYE
ncbi:MAG: ABC transporter permease [Armatimonadetes bacterium]|nr:ABC transporter permease [Armatimonadota bacterium]